MSELAEVRGQESAKRALEIAAAGGHHILLVGPPGAGKTMLARCLPGLLPPLTRAEAADLTPLYEAVGAPPPAAGGPRSFRSPDPGVGVKDLVGGGPRPKPGEVSLAHHGVLFLDEIPQFRRNVQEALRQPLEDGVVELVRSGVRHTFSARCLVVAAMNACPCGHLGDPAVECVCSPRQAARYRAGLSGPLLDRIDLHVEVPPVTLSELESWPGEASETVAARVAAARRIQRERFAKAAETPTNAAMGPAEVRRFCALDDRGRRLLDSAYERLGLSARALHRILKVSRTLADLAGQEAIQAGHVAEAIQYRSLDRRVEA